MLTFYTQDTKEEDGLEEKSQEKWRKKTVHSLTTKWDVKEK